ncbi:glycosyltransferase [Nocardioides agariphilus]|jgi:glycosyltransferase involved in cell wall biosynthesis|uniref:Glycosyltransferase n=1 Tax=Nocardioides agariphilus TaxID=433664 RepID=A0A930VL61_9ACTN|nr:glycosyltransferase [Nocardioides agariphilus]MBF4766641.1 glycosyltransferase [Nocardioides agariphilus]
MPRLAIASIATAVPMGAQRYETEMAARAQSALTPYGDWCVRRVLVRSLRSPLPGDRRMPMSRVGAASVRERRLAGRVLYPRADIVHRTALELPPARVDVVTLHDVVAWRFPDESAPVPAAAEELRRAAAVICVSAFSAGQAVELLGIEPPHVVHNGVDPRYLDAAPLAPSQLAALGITGPYVLTVGGASKRKNLEGLAAAWPAIHAARPDVTLALVGPEHPERTRLFAGLPGTRLLGRQPDEVVPGLYASASVVVVPSTYEGFGLPALEGMAAGAPVVAADTSALPEVVGDGGFLVEPTPDGIVDGTLAALAGGADVETVAARGRRRAAEFTWERSARGHAEVWASVAR